MSITSSTSNRNSTKLRVVFLGDQGVGKSSIIDRYTTSRFNDNYNVDSSLFRQLSESILMSRILIDMGKFSDFRCGIRLGRRGTVVWFLHIWRMRIAWSLCLMSQIQIRCRGFEVGRDFSYSISKLLAYWWGIKSTWRVRGKESPIKKSESRGGGVVGQVAQA